MALCRPPLVVPVALALFALFAGCADLPPIGANVCGNAVVEPEVKEDCDTFATRGTGTACAPPSDSLRACHYICGGSGAAATVCPTGWACGGDGVCRFPSGAFLRKDPIATGGQFLSAADLDGDGHTDLAAVRDFQLDLRYGLEGGGFPSSSVPVVVGAPTAAPVYHDLSGDGIHDAVIPEDSGLVVMLGQTDRTLSPVAYSSVVLPPLFSQVELLPVTADFVFSTFLILSNPIGADRMEMAFFAPQHPNAVNPAYITTLLGAHRVADVAGRIPRADLGGGLEEELALGFYDEDNVRIYGVLVHAGATQFDPSEYELQLLDVVSLPAGVRLHRYSPDRGVMAGPGPPDPGPTAKEAETQNLRFADVDGDGALDLMAFARLLDGSERVFVARGDRDAGTGLPTRTFGAFLRQDLFDSLLAENVDPACNIPFGLGASPWPLAAGDFDRDGVADYVTAGGVYLNLDLGGTRHLCPTGFSPRPLVEAAVGDFNRDDLPDVAGVAAGQPGVVFLMGTGFLFNPFVVPTTDAATKLRVGDFDGDFVADLAVVERIVDPQTQADTAHRQSVLFGERQGAPREAVSMGELQFIQYSEPMQLAAGSFDITGDLLVQSNSQADGQGTHSIAPMIGTAQRRMLAPFQLSSSAGADGDVAGQERILSVHAGRFDLAATQDAIPDLVALTYLGELNAGAPPNLFLIRGSGNARFTPDDTALLEAGLGTNFDCPPPEQFSYHCAMYAAANLDGDDSPDDLVAVDGGIGCEFAFDPVSGNVMAPPVRVLVGRFGGTVAAPSVECGNVPGPTTLQLPIDIKVADLDRDGKPDLLVVYSGLPDTVGADEVSGSGVAVYWNDGQGALGPTPAVVPLPAETQVVSGAAVLNADESAALEVAVKTDLGVYVATFDAQSREFAEARLAIEAEAGDGSDGIDGFGRFRPKHLFAADVNGDGLDDLLVDDGHQTFVYVTVPEGEEEGL